MTGETEFAGDALNPWIARAFCGRRAVGGNRPYRSVSDGFTLIEVLAALLFLAILVPVVLQALSLSNHISSLSERRAVAAELAENKLNEELIGNYWQAATATKGDFGTDYLGYRWEMTQGGWSGDSTNGMTQLTMEVIFPVQGRDQSVKLTTLVSAAVGVQSTSGTSSAMSSPTTGGTAK